MNNNPLPKKHEMIFYTLIHNSRCDPAHKFSGKKLKDIGLHFGIGVSGVSQASRLVALQIKDDKKLK
jgi:hypothetical protein